MSTEKWQYKTLRLKTGTFSTANKQETEIQDSLNRLGAQGWELVSISPDKMGFFWAFLKKPL